MESTKHFFSHPPMRPVSEEVVIDLVSPLVISFDSPSICLRAPAAKSVRFLRVNSIQMKDMVIVEFKAQQSGHVRMWWESSQAAAYANRLYFVGLEAWGLTPAVVQLAAVSRKAIHCEMEHKLQEIMMSCMCTNVVAICPLF